MANRKQCDRGQSRTGTILIPVVMVILLLWMDYHKRHTGPRFPHDPSNFKEGYCRGQHHRNRIQVLPSEVILGYLESLLGEDIQTERVLGKVPETGEFDLADAGFEGQEEERGPGSDGTEVGALGGSRGGGVPEGRCKGRRIARGESVVWLPGKGRVRYLFVGNYGRSNEVVRRRRVGQGRGWNPNRTIRGGGPEE